MARRQDEDMDGMMTMGVSALEPLYEQRDLRLYTNRIEIDHRSLLGRVKRTDVVYYSDITDAKRVRKQLILGRSLMRALMLDFDTKDHAKLGLEIINAFKE